METPPYSQVASSEAILYTMGQGKGSFIVGRRPMARITVEPAAGGDDLCDSFLTALKLSGESGIKPAVRYQAGLKIRGHSRARSCKGR
jgi:hypothetical protein